MEALSAAGISVYATRGPDGGWSLVEGYRSGLNGLTTTDVLAIVVGRPQGLLADLGLDDPGDAPDRTAGPMPNSSSKTRTISSR